MSEMTVGCIRTTVNPPSGIYEALLEKAQCELEMWRDGNILHEMHRDELAKVERERDEAIAARKASAADWLNQIAQSNARVSRALQQVALAERDRDEAREEIRKIAVYLRKYNHDDAAESLEIFLEAAK